MTLFRRVGTCAVLLLPAVLTVFGGHPAPVEARAAPVLRPQALELRFLVGEFPLPAGERFARVPMGLPLRAAVVLSLKDGAREVRLASPALVSLGLEAAPPAAPRALASRCALTWTRLVPEHRVYSNLQAHRRTGKARLAPVPIFHRREDLAVHDPWWVDLDQLAPRGTTRFMVRAACPGGEVATPGPEAIHLDAQREPVGGLSSAVYGVSRRGDSSLRGWAVELEGLPFLYSPLGEDPTEHETERRVGADCTSTFIYAMRRRGLDLLYYGPREVGPYVRRVVSGLHRGRGGIYRDAREAPARLDTAARVGDFLHFGNQLSLLVQDRSPFGLLDDHDLLLQTWLSAPRRVTLARSSYARRPVDIVRFRSDLPHQKPAPLIVALEDSHAVGFYAGIESLASGPATLILVDRHSDASAHPLAAELVRHGPRPPAEWIANLRREGQIQAFNWVDALIPWGITRVHWLGPWEEKDRTGEERTARAQLCSLSQHHPGRGFICRAERFGTSRLADLLALPVQQPVVISIDLDYLLDRAGRVRAERARDIHQLLRHFREVRGVSLALSRPYFPDEQSVERALRALVPALYGDPRVGGVVLRDLGDPAHDHSRRAEELRAAGRPVPRPSLRTLSRVPGLTLDSSTSFALGFLGDLYLSTPDTALPRDLPLRRPWEPVEDLPLVINLETPVDRGRPVSGYPRFNQHPSLLRWLAEQGVLLVNLANNHALDQGPTGLRRTITEARAAGLGVTGAWLPGEKARGEVRLALGRSRCAFFGVTEQLNRTDGYVGNIEVVPYRSMDGEGETRQIKDRFLARVRRAAAAVDLVVVQVHGGDELDPDPSHAQRRWFHELAAAGARIIVGHHSHLASRVEHQGQALALHGLGDIAPRQGTSGLAVRVWLRGPGEGKGLELEWESHRRAEGSASWHPER